jgi:hypothetical protein
MPDAQLSEAKVSKVEVKGTLVQRADGAADAADPQVDRKPGKMAKELGANPLILGNRAEKANPKGPFPVEEVQNPTGRPLHPREPNPPRTLPPKQALQMPPHSSFHLLQWRRGTGRNLREQTLSIDVRRHMEVSLAHFVHRNRSCPSQREGTHFPQV